MPSVIRKRCFRLKVTTCSQNSSTNAAQCIREQSKCAAAQREINILTPEDFEMELKATKEGEDEGDMDLKFEVSQDATKFTKVQLTDCPPPTYPQRMVLARVDMLSENKISIVWS